MNNTAFHIMVDKERENGYLVTHTNESRKYARNQHSFKVIADVGDGIFECECRSTHVCFLDAYISSFIMLSFKVYFLKKVPSHYVQYNILVRNIN
jgi:hypothetical protein